MNSILLLKTVPVNFVVDTVVVTTVSTTKFTGTVFSSIFSYDLIKKSEKRLQNYANVLHV